MGYEIQMIVGVATDMNFKDKRKRFFMTYATIDMCKLGNCALMELDYQNKEDDDLVWEFYAPAGDGNTPVSEDRYGGIPKPIPIMDVIAALAKDTTTDGYRRFHWALSLLKAIEESSNETLHVMLWGH